VRRVVELVTLGCQMLICTDVLTDLILWVHPPRSRTVIFASEDRRFEDRRG